MVRLLRSLIKELTDLINADIMPRWKKKHKLVDCFLDNLEYPHGNALVAGSGSVSAVQRGSSFIGSMFTRASGVNAAFGFSMFKPVPKPT